jgi:hypothetical protein
VTYGVESIDENGGGPGKATPEEGLVDLEISGEPRIAKQERQR